MAHDVLGVIVRVSVLPDKIDEFVSTAQRIMIEPSQSAGPFEMRRLLRL